MCAARGEGVAIEGDGVSIAQKIFRAGDRVLAHMLLALVRAYQWTLSPLLGSQCRFYPTCSRYAAVALREHSGVRGGWLTVRRLCRCHPLSRGGIDLVPESTTPVKPASVPTGREVLTSNLP